MYITIITDCTSQNDRGRQETRFVTLFQMPISFVGIESTLGNNSTIEAAGNLIDVLDASDDQRGIVIVNVAPRGNKNEGKNGNFFCYFRYKNSLVISSTKGYTLSLVKKLKLVDSVNILDTEKVLDFAVSQKLISQDLKNHIVNSQFRSFDFVPRVAKWLTDGVKLPFNNTKIEQFDDIPACIWLIDSFGNAKSTLLKEAIQTGPDKKVKTNLGNFHYYQRLKDIPKGETAIYIGSSGIENQRFVEIATQGIPGSATKKLKLKVGQRLNLL